MAASRYGVVFGVLWIVSAQAGGNRVGNGGHLVDCVGKRPQLLDLWESGAVVAKAEPSPRPSSSVENALRLAREKVDRLKSLDLKLHRTLTLRLESMKDDIEWRRGVELAAIDDSSHLMLPQGCRLVQVAIRKNEISPKKRFLIQQDLWDRLALLDQSALLTHEAIYDYFYKLGETDSRKVRDIVGRLSGEKALWESASAYRKWVQDQRLALYP